LQVRNFILPLLRNLRLPLTQHIGITERAIKMQIEKMKSQGRIQRIGPDKGGCWKVAE